MDDREMYEQDRDHSIIAAEDIALDQPGLDVDEILAILDEEFRGSTVCPSGDSVVRLAVENIWQRTRPITG